MPDIDEIINSEDLEKSNISNNSSDSLKLLTLSNLSTYHTLIDAKKEEKSVLLTWAEYQALSPEEKMNGKSYYITDIGSQGYAILANDIVMDGYVEPEQTSPITTGDTANSAIGKLEKSTDNLTTSVNNIEELIPSNASTSNKLATMEDIVTGGQVNSDWEATSGVAEILHKPILGTASSFDVAESGDATSTQVVKGDDSRLTNARTPVSHTHTKNEITDFPTLGTASAKNSTNAVIAESTDLVESGAVKSAIDNIVSSAYHHAGTKTVAELTSALLVSTNEGDVYNITDSGVTTADFIEGAGKTINVGANVGVAKISDNVYKFDLLSGFIDTSDFVEKSATNGLLRNDGSVDTNNYLTEHQDISNYVQKSNTNGLIKNDGTIDTSHYLTEHQDISNYVQKSNTEGLLKNDGTVDTNSYLTSVDKATTNTVGTVKPDDTTIKIDNNGTISTEAVKIDSNTNIKFGIDGNGNYGYIKDGADTVTPFKNPTGNKSIGPILENGTITDIDVEDFATASIEVAVPGGGGEPNLQAKYADVAPVQQVIKPDAGYDGLSQVTIYAGLKQTKTVNPSTSQQIVNPDAGYYGLSQVTVKPVSLQSKTISPSVSSQTITPDSTYLGLSDVTVSAATKQEKTVSPSTSAQTVTPDSGYYGLSKVTVNAATKHSKTVTPSSSSQTVYPNSGYYGLSSVTVNAVQTQAKTATPTTTSQTITPDSGKFLSSVTVGAVPIQSKTIAPSTSEQTVTPDSGNFLSSVTVGAINTQTKTVSPSTSSQIITPDNGKYLSSVTVEAATKQAKTVSPSGTTQNVTPDEGYYGLSKVTVNPVATQSKNHTITSLNETVEPDEGYLLSSVNISARLQQAHVIPNAETQWFYPDDDSLGFFNFYVDPIPSKYYVKSTIYHGTFSGTGYTRQSFCSAYDITKFIMASMVIDLNSSGSSQYTFTLAMDVEYGYGSINTVYGNTTTSQYGNFQDLTTTMTVDLPGIGNVTFTDFGFKVDTLQSAARMCILGTSSYLLADKKITTYVKYY